MDKIETFFGNAPEAVRQEFLRNIKIRSIDQKFLYFGEGAERYYKYGTYVWPAQETFDMLQEFLSKDERIGIISLACGRARHDSEVLHLLHEAGYNFKFIGIDASEEMVNKAQVTLEPEKFEYELWQADISTYDFYERTREETRQFDKVVFVFMGGTIGNMIQTEIVDTLFNLMQPGNLLLFDCVVRPSANKLGDLELFNRYAEFLHAPQVVDLMFYPLEVLGIPRDVGTLMLENIPEESIGVINFRYSFRFKEPTKCHFLNEYIHFLPPERIRLLEIRGYHAETMIKYFDLHDFKVVQQGAKGADGQFIFRKN